MFHDLFGHKGPHQRDHHLTNASSVVVSIEAGRPLIPDTGSSPTGEPEVEPKIEATGFSAVEDADAARNNSEGTSGPCLSSQHRILQRTVSATND